MTTLIAQGPLERMVSRLLSWLPLGRRFREEQKEQTLIEHGQKWVLSSAIDDGSPWPVTKQEWPVTILDARDGWVRYSFGGNGMFDDCRMTENMFRGMYRLMTANV